MTRLRGSLAAAAVLLVLALAVETAWRGVGGLLLLSAAVAAGVGLWLEAGGLQVGSRRWSRAGRRLQAASGALLAAALGLLVAAFLRADVGYGYVWAHTAAGLPWTYRLAGTWAGQEGTVLLWAALAALAVTRLLPQLAPDEGEAPGGGPRALAAATHLVVGGFVLALAGFLLAEPPFAATAAARLADPATADGAGLNELLVTPFMVIHPPVQFLAYALAAVPGGLALAGLAAGDDAWIGPARAWGRRAWLAATAGLGLGALWAYYVLSFGGYWVWDPVETANVLPWIGLLAFLHAARDHEATGGAPVVAPLLAAGAWIATAFATVAVRSGLWTSVHAFTDPTTVFEPDPGRRLLDILAVHAPTRFFTGIVLALAFLAAALLLRRHGPDLAPSGHRWRAVQAAVALEAGLVGLALLAPRPLLGVLLEAGRLLVPAWPGAGLGLVLAALVGGPALAAAAAAGDDPAPHAWSRFQRLGAVLLTLAGAVTLLLLLRSVNGFTPGFYDQRVPFVALPIVATMTAMLAWHPLGPRRSLALAAAGAAAAVAAALAWPGRWVLAGALPALAAAVAAAAARLHHTGAPRDPHPDHAAAGALLLAAGLLGLLTWSNPPSAVPVPGGLVPVPAALAALLWPASLLALAGSLASFRGGPARLARAGAAGGLLAAGLGVGAALAAGAWALLRRAPARGVSWRAYGAAARPYAIHLAHLGALVGLLGWAASTYGGATADLTASPGGPAVEVEGLAFSLGGARGEPAGDGDWYAAVEVPVEVREDGRLRAQGTLRLYHRGPPVDHYDPNVDVQRGPARDLVLHPRAFHVADVGWVEAHGNTSRLESTEVTEARFTAGVRPGMALLWTGLVLVSAGTAGLVAAEAGLRREAS